MKYRAVLFDFDGVIAHTIPIFRQAMFRFFREKNLTVTESDFEADGWASKSLALINAGLESDPNLIPLLEYCRASGIQIAIGSNSFRDRVEWVIKKMGIDTYFLHDAARPEQ